jgi:ribonucleotide reductase alpha subunit
VVSFLQKFIASRNHRKYWSATAVFGSAIFSLNGMMAQPADENLPPSNPLPDQGPIRKESKAGSLIQVAPEYNKLKNRYQLMWEQRDCDGYLKTASVLAAYVDQSISTNTFYNPAHFADRKVPTTLIARNLMLAHRWGLKTFYYSLINKQGSKGQDELPELKQVDIEVSEEDCEACKL